MAALSVDMILKLVDKASGPGKGIIDRLFGGRRGITGNALAATGAMSMLNRSIAGVSAGVGSYIGLKSMVGGAIEFETAMAEVRKLVDATPKQFADLEASIKRVAAVTPIAATEMAGLVAQAGQFGIPTEDLTRFATFGAKAAGAFQMGAEETGESLSQIRNALGLNMDQLEAYADAINYVADRNGSSERQLVDYALRTGAGARAAGLDPRDLLAIGSAMTEVGLSSQRAATATNAMLTKMTDLEDKGGEFLDKVGGKGYSERLQKKFYDNPREAMIDMLRMSKEMSRPDRAQFFKKLFGLETQDEANALAGNIEKVVQTVAELGNATNYAGSVQKTFDIFTKTTAGQWKIFTNNIDMATAAFGARLLPTINTTLEYLNHFFATADGRVNVFERMSTAANGFFNGLGFKGGTAEALGGITDFLREVRDLLFGMEGDGLSGDKLGETFAKWQAFGENLRNSPVTAVMGALADIDGWDLATGLGAAALGLGAFGMAAKIALLPLRGVLAAMRGIVGAAKVLSGYSLAKMLLGGGGGRGATAGGALAWLARLKATPWALAALTTFKALEAKGPADPRLIHPEGAATTRNESVARTGNPITGEREPPPPAAPVEEPVPFSFRQLWDDLTTWQPVEGGPKPVTVNGSVQTSPSGVQSVLVTNPSPAPIVNVNVTVHANTNASPAEIGAAVGNSVSSALRQNLADGGL